MVEEKLNEAEQAASMGRYAEALGLLREVNQMLDDLEDMEI